MWFKNYMMKMVSHLMHWTKKSHLFNKMEKKYNWINQEK